MMQASEPLDILSNLPEPAKPLLTNKNLNFQGLPNHLFLAIDHPTYPTGSFVSGIVVLTVQTPQLLENCINLGIFWEGIEHVDFKAGFQNDVSADRKIFSKTQMLWKRPESVTSNPFEVGTYTFRFTWELPQGIAGNFEDDEDESIFSNITTFFNQRTNTNIRYSATAFLNCEQPLSQNQASNSNQNLLSDSKSEETDAPQKKMITSQVAARSYFKVTERYNPEVLDMSPLEKIESTSFYFSSGDLKVKILLRLGQVSFSGYRIPIHIQVTNNSNRTVEEIRTVFNRISSFSYQSHSISKKNMVFAGLIANSSVPPSGEFSRDLLVDVPTGTPPTVELATLIKREYELSVELKIPYSSSDFCVGMPIKIFSPTNLDEPFLKNFLQNTVVVAKPPQAPQGSTDSEAQPQSQPVFAQNPENVKEQEKKGLLSEDSLSQNEVHQSSEVQGLSGKQGEPEKQVNPEKKEGEATTAQENPSEGQQQEEEGEKKELAAENQ